MTVSTGRASGFHVADAGAAMISASERFHIQAEGYAQPFRIDIALPAAPVQPGQTLPVIYVLDGNWSFAIAAQIARALTIGPEAIPSAIIVGIGYAIDGPAAFGATAALRYRDLAHGIDEKHVAMMREMIPPALWPDGAPVGKSMRFSRFIEDQLKPFIQSRYPVDASTRHFLAFRLAACSSCVRSSPRHPHSSVMSRSALPSGGIAASCWTRRRGRLPEAISTPACSWASGPTNRRRRLKHAW
ncbi:MAG: hypothetical protein QM773_10895 [Hyphomonadaceae bacterium]